MKQLITKLIDLVFPPRCLLCDEILEIKDEYVCRDCNLDDYIISSNVCKSCGRPIILIDEYCKDCKDNKHYFDKGWALLKYDSIIHSTMYRLKYGNRRDVGVNLARLIINQFENEINKLNIDAIIPVPLHKERYRDRGYNQANIIAKSVGTALSIPVDDRTLIRIKNTKPQSGLGLKGRKNNLIGAFQLKGKTSYKRVLVIDDIYTTGSTINTCAKLLKQGGIIEVYFIVAAIAIT